MKILIASLILIVCFQAFAQDEDEKYLGFIYQQQSPQVDDPKGDLLLLQTANQIPKFIKASLKGKTAELLKDRDERLQRLTEKYPEFKPAEEKTNKVVEDYVTHNPDHVAIELEGHQAPFKVKNMANMMKQVISEEYQQKGTVPQEGTIHKWSESSKKEMKKQFPVFARLPKLLVALSRGSTSSYMVTGTENSLSEYILSRPVNSINMEEMFRASYRINKGDVYLTLLTVENVLSRYWLTPGREKRAITTRLKDITNYNYKTDKFGSWYHLFGIMLYGYAHGSLGAKIVGKLETLGSHVMDKFKNDEKQEDIINAKGGSVGARLRRFVKHEDYKDFKSDPSLAEEACYMNLNEDFSDRLAKAVKKQVAKED
jgi:hypothetical protein